MDFRDLVNKEKLRCDNIISIILIFSIVFLFVFFRLMLFISLMVYPISSLFLYGIYYIYRVLLKKDKLIKTRVVRLILGIFYIVFSSFFLWLIFSYPHVSLNYAVFFLSIPVFFIGLAAILKGSIVYVYSSFYRKLNILTGAISLMITILAVYLMEINFIFSLTSLIGILALNGVMRSGLYLSEYGLSLRNFDNIKYVFFIMDNLIILNLEEDFKHNSQQNKHSRFLT